MPAMIAKAENPSLKQALEQHLRVTENQRERIDQVRQMMGADEESVTKYSGILSNFFEAGSKCKGMEGLIDEAEKVMTANLSSEVMDAAIMGVAKKLNTTKLPLMVRHVLMHRNSACRRLLNCCSKHWMKSTGQMKY
jgi:ferritin-like metal-binding protein YciE